MNGTRFDSVARMFTERRLTRRRALVSGGAGLTAAGIAGAGLAAAQGATPAADVAPTDAEKIPYLFVQTYQSGSLVAAEDGSGTYTLTLDGGAGQTIYFSDRPAREVGIAPTDAFFEGLGFAEDNPPNAAVLMEVEPGDQDIAVVELYNPSVDPASGTVTYDVKGLHAWDMSFRDEPTDLADMSTSFGLTNLFIDDCADANITCYAEGTTYGVFQNQGMCWDWQCICCLPCEPYYHNNPEPEDVQSYWNQQCASTYNCPEGPCQASW